MKRRVLVITAVTVAVLAFLNNLANILEAPDWLAVLAAAFGLVAVLADLVIRERTNSRANELPVREDWAGHFDARGRGTEAGDVSGWYYSGRAPAIHELTTWLRGGSDTRTRVITGSPGSGKSALLGRLWWMLTGDNRRRFLREEPETGAQLPRAAIDFAFVNARRKTASEVAEHLGLQLGLEADTPGVLIDAINSRKKLRRVAIDSLDEAGNPDDPRTIDELIEKLVQPLTASPFVQLLVAVRRPWLRWFVDSRFLTIDLDEDKYFDHRDLVDYVLRRLSSPGSPYAQRLPDALRIAHRVAARAGRNFLVAQIVTRDLVGRAAPVDTSVPGWDEFPDSVRAAVAQDLRGLGAAEGPVRDALTALAHAEGEGLPRTSTIWEAIGRAIAGSRPFVLESLFREERGMQYITSVEIDGLRLFRLYHEALEEELRAVAPPDVQKRIVAALIGTVPLDDLGRRDWSSSAQYVREHLATHARMAGSLAELVQDPAYVLAATPDRLITVLGSIIDGPSLAVATAIRLSEDALLRSGMKDAAVQLAVSARQVGADAFADQICAYRFSEFCAAWAHWTAMQPHRLVVRVEHELWGLAVTTHAGKPAVVTGGADGALRLTDLVTGRLMRTDAALRGNGWVRDVSVSTLSETNVAVAGGDDGRLRSWRLDEPLEESQTSSVAGPAIWTIATGELQGRSIAVSGNRAGHLQVWDLESLTPWDEPMRTGQGGLRGVAVGNLGALVVAVTGGDDGRLSVWDLTSAEKVDMLPGHRWGWVGAVAMGHIDDRCIAVSGGEDGRLQVWDLEEFRSWGPSLSSPRATWIGAVALQPRNDPIAAVGYGDGSLGLWNLRRRELLERPRQGHRGWIGDVALRELEGRAAVLSAGADGTLRVWSVDAGNALDSTKRVEPERSLALAGGRGLVASGGQDGSLRLRDVATGVVRAVRASDSGAIQSLAAVTHRGRTTLLSAGRSGLVRLWDLESLDPLHGVLEHSTAVGVWVRALAAGPAGDDYIVACGGDAGSISVWDFSTRTRRGLLQGHHGWVRALAVTSVDQQAVVVSAGQDGRVRFWDIETGNEYGMHPLRDGQASVLDSSRQPENWVLAVAVGDLQGRPSAVTGHWDGFLRTWDVGSGTLTDEVRAHGGHVEAVAVCEFRGQMLIASGGGDGRLRVSQQEVDNVVARVSLGFPIRALHVTPLTAGDLSITAGSTAGLMTFVLRLGDSQPSHETAL